VIRAITFTLLFHEGERMGGKKNVWTWRELKELLDKGEVPYVDNTDRYKVIRDKLYEETMRKLYRIRRENDR